MSEDDYLNCIDAIKEYIRSEKIAPFGAEHFADTILSQLDA